MAKPLELGLVMPAGSPLFSILITSYNRPASVVACLESVLANEDEDFEVIIGDDASPSSEAIANAVRPYLSRPNIRIHRHSSNMGEPANRNYLVAQARGQYNIILCDDDTLLPHALRTLRRYIERQPDQDMYLFGYRVVDESGVRCYDRVAPRSLAINLHQRRLVRRMFEATWLSFLLFHQATFCCRRGIERELEYRREFAPADDYMFLLECLNKGKRLYVLPECLMTYRWCLSGSGINQVNQSSDIVRTMTASTRVYYAFQERNDLHPLVAGIIGGTAYRRRFLYDIIIRRMPISEDSIASLRLRREHRHEFEAYRLNVSRPAILLKAALRIMVELMREFGFKGMTCWIRAAFAYARYRAFRTYNGWPGLLRCGFLANRG